MVKPKAIQWLEEQTGQNIPYDPEATTPETESVTSLFVSTGPWRAASTSWRPSAVLSVSQLVRDIIADKRSGHVRTRPASMPERSLIAWRRMWLRFVDGSRAETTADKESIQAAGRRLVAAQASVSSPPSSPGR